MARGGGAPSRLHAGQSPAGPLTGRRPPHCGRRRTGSRPSAAAGSTPAAPTARGGY